MKKEIIKKVDMDYVNKMIENGYEAFGDLTKPSREFPQPLQVAG